jgi:hypothetical protein
MNLEDFVNQSLTDILKGIKEAQLKNLKENPGPLHTARIVTKDDGSRIVPDVSKLPKGHFVNKIEFDIVVSTSDEVSGEAKTSIIVGIVNLKSWFGFKRTKSAENRIKFSVPILYPTNPKNS